MKTDFPPEAYSKELLSEAFNWLQNQEESVRELVQTPENLITIYRNHQKRAETDAPVSSKQFISDLKTLARGIEEFDNGPMANTGFNKAPSATLTKDLPKSPQPASKRPMEAYTPPPPPKASEKSTPARSQAQPPPKSTFIEPKNPAKATFSGHDVDPESRKMIQQTRLRFNLSSDSEALRMLLALGFEKLTKV